METKHTKGKWILDCYNTIVNENKEPIYFTGLYVTECGTEEVQANTKLVAAAPLMLEALIAMYDSCKPKKFGEDLLNTDLTSVGSVTMPSEAAILKMCNAIKKATK